METSTIIDLVEEMIEKRVKPLEDRIAELEEKAAAATTAEETTSESNKVKRQRGVSIYS